MAQTGIRPGIEGNAIQHLIKQRSIAAGTCDVERPQDAVLDDIHVINGHSAVEVCALAADVTSLNREVPCQLALNFDVEVLNVGIDTMIVESQQRIGSHIEWFLSQRLHAGRCRQRHGKIR